MRRAARIALLWAAVHGLAAPSGAHAADAPPPPAPCLALTGCAQLSAMQVMEAADRYRTGGRAADAERLLAGLVHDPDRQMRAEARFRMAQLREEGGNVHGAIASLRQLLLDQPEAQRPRLELARLLAFVGDDRGARRELRTASATGLPDDVALTVNRFQQALRSTRAFGGSVEVAVAPDSNINRATARDTVNTVIVPLKLDEDARARSGLGVTLGGQGYWRVGLGERSALLTRAFARGDFYGRGRFNDVVLGANVGPELVVGSTRVRPAAIASRRWFGGRHFSDGIGGTLSVVRPLSSTSQVDADASVIASRFPGIRGQDGVLFDAQIGYDRAFSARTSGRVSLRASRQTAEEPGLATAGAGGELVVTRGIGRQLLFAQVGYNRLEADARLALFPERRRDDRFDLGAGLILRGLAIHGLAPLVRVTRTVNRSTVELFDFSRTRVEFGLTRAF